MRKNTKARRVGFFGMLTHYLKSKTDTQHRLLQGRNEGVESMFSEIGHGRPRFSNTRNNDMAGGAKLSVIVRDLRLHSEAFHRKQDGLHVAGVVFENGYRHKIRSE